MSDDLRIREAAIVEGVDDDGSVLLHLIRPCVGRGRGKHLYEASMLEANAGKFVGWKMFVDHESPEARKKAGGLPRSVHDVGGIIKEAWWDGSVPADPENGFGAGAVVGRAKPTKLIRDLVETDPGIVGTSINTMATGIKSVMHNGQRVNLVEGISDKGSVDWVTEAGAGGRVVALMEASMDEPLDAEIFGALSDDEMLAYLGETRPGLIEAAKKAAADPEDKADGGADDDLESKIAALVKKGMPRVMAEKVAKRQLAQAQQAATVKAGEEGKVAEVETPAVTVEAIREALASDEGRELRLALVQEALASEDGQALLRGMIEDAVAEERDLIRQEAAGHADRGNVLRDLRDKAHSMVAEARLPESLKSQIRKQFTLVEGVPTDALDVEAEVDADGNVVKSTEDVLAEAVAGEIESARRIVAEINPTQIRQAVAGAPLPESSEGEGKKERVIGDATTALMESAGFTDPDKIWA